MAKEGKKPIRADMIIRQLARRHYQDLFYTQVKNGPTHLATQLRIMDAVAIKKSWVHPEIIAYEVKVSRSDFTGDDKWKEYLQYCHRFAFACPTGLISQDELPKEVGLVYYNPDKDTITTRRKALLREIDWPTDMLFYLLISRANDEKDHPFFTDRRDMLQAWVTDKADRRALAKEIKGKIREIIRGTKEAEDKMEDMQAELSAYREVKSVLEAAGYRTNRYAIKQSVESLINQDLPQRMKATVYKLFHEVDQLRRMVGNREEEDQ